MLLLISAAEDWIFITVGGFLLGAVMYTGYYTTRFEPQVRNGYFFIGGGILLSVGVNTYIDFQYDLHNWYRGVTLLVYTLVTTGLILVVAARRREHREKDRPGDDMIGSHDSHGSKGGDRTELK